MTDGWLQEKKTTKHFLVWHFFTPEHGVFLRCQLEQKLISVSNYMYNQIKYVNEIHTVLDTTHNSPDEMKTSLL